MTYDVIVAGVGGHGSATCYQLALRGQKVLGLERFDIANSMGSSHGITRIIRLAYFEGPFYVPMLRRAVELWRETGDRFGEPLMITTGGLDIAPEGHAIFEGALESCRVHGLPHEVLTGADINARFAGFRLPANLRAVYEAEAGFILSERAIVAHVALAQSAGAEIRARERVVEWTPIAGGGVRVRTDRGVYEAGRLIVAAGAWLAELVPQLAPLAVPERQVLGWFQPATPARFTPDVFPVTILDVPEGAFYLLPSYGIPGVKIGLHRHFQETGTPETLSREATARDEAALRACLAAYFPDANGPVMALRTCLYTLTPDETFIVDALPGHEEVIIASPCSGHGYKFASVMGEILADLATSGSPRFDIAPFRLSRFA
ncbi:MAG TPA: N-methyl-L-tryptophan oxidase [Bauldia sp.]|nr:N-methyl-L-tryptophan oxidase [Bauldia sp.]